MDYELEEYKKFKLKTFNVMRFESKTICLDANF